MLEYSGACLQYLHHSGLLVLATQCFLSILQSAVVTTGLCTFSFTFHFAIVSVVW